MARIPYPADDDLDERTRALLDANPPLNVFRMLAHGGPALGSFLRLTGGLWNDAELSPRRRELVILRVATRCHSPYEWRQHVAVAGLVGITDEEIEAVGAGRLDALGADEAAMLALADVIIDRDRADDAVLDAARAVLTDRELIELHLLIAAYAGLAALMTTVDLDVDDAQGAALLARGARGPRFGERG